MPKPFVNAPLALHDMLKNNGTRSADHALYNTEPSMTRQEFAEECDINSLMKRYEGHGTSINHLLASSAQGGSYIDFADLPQDLMGYMQFMQAADAAFMSLPAVVRREFDNNPVAFVEFASDPQNIEQMRAWDLAPPAAAKSPAEGPPEAAPGAGEPGGVVAAAAAPSSSPGG